MASSLATMLAVDLVAENVAESGVLGELDEQLGEVYDPSEEWR